jgi:HKD family nuclease
VTGDYLAFTHVIPLRELLAWSQLEPEHCGNLQVRVVDTICPGQPERAFHPKSWRFESSTFGVGFVGSSNISRSALETGVAWRGHRVKTDPVDASSIMG